MTAMQPRILTLFAALAACAVAAPPDLDRAIAFAKQVEGKVFRAKVELHWQNRIHTYNVFQNLQ